MAHGLVYEGTHPELTNPRACGPGRPERILPTHCRPCVADWTHKRRALARHGGVGRAWPRRAGRAPAFVLYSLMMGEVLLAVSLGAAVGNSRRRFWHGCGPVLVQMWALGSPRYADHKDAPRRAARSAQPRRPGLHRGFRVPLEYPRRPFSSRRWARCTARHGCERQRNRRVLRTSRGHTNAM
jgi:hypothetical protein